MKWLIERDETSAGPQAEEEKWAKIHQDGYQIWSMSADESVQEKIAAALLTIPHERVLIVGCGSVVDLQLMLIARFEEIREIVCLDFQPVIELAKKKGSHDKIRYLARDARDMGFERCFDVVVNVNAILSEADEDNRRILASCVQALKPGGSLLGFFPTIFCQEEVLSLEKRYNRFKRVWAARAAKPVYDQARLTDGHDILDMMAAHGQLYYTPLYLRMILRQAGLLIDRFEFFFCQSPAFREQAKTKFAVLDEDVLIYEFFIHARRDDGGIK